jgi:glutamate-1-semialdehyde 2,1-aminomutase
MCGHAPKAVTQAALRQFKRGATMMLPTEDSLWVGTELSRRFGARYWTLTTSATDANRGAIRIARMITGRTKVLVFSGCYHGGVEEAHVEIRDGRVGMRNMVHPNGVDHNAVTSIVEFNDIKALEAALSRGDVACVLTEPLMTNFGMIPVADGFHRALRDITRRTGTVLIIDETHTIPCGLGGYTQLHGLEPDIFVAGKAIAGGIPAGLFGLSREIAERLWRIVPYVNPRERQSAHLGIGGTLAGSALTVATMRAVLENVLTGKNYVRMIANATRLAKQARNLIEASQLPWHVTQIGARAEIMFMPRLPRSGADVIAGRQAEMETLLHAFYMNEGILVTPFHTMLLMCPATSVDDVRKHTSVFGRFVDLVHKAKVV